MGVNPIYGNEDFPTRSVSAAERNVKELEIKFNKAVSYTKADAVRHTETDQDVNFVKYEIKRLEAELTNQKLSKEKRNEITNKIKDLKAQYSEQTQLADAAVSKDGKYVKFTIKKDVPAEVLKDKFHIEDGAFRESLKAEALSMSGYGSYDEAMMSGVTEFDNGVFLVMEPDGHYFPNYTRALLYRGGEYIVYGSEFDPPREKEGLFGWGFLGL